MFCRGVLQSRALHSVLGIGSALSVCAVPSRATSSTLKAAESKPKTLRVALCQLPVVEDKTVNIETAKKAIASAAANGAELVVLPEVWNSSYLASAFPKNAEPVPKGP